MENETNENKKTELQNVYLKRFILRKISAAVSLALRCHHTLI
jgi:hypothetical protein